MVWFTQLQHLLKIPSSAACSGLVLQPRLFIGVFPFSEVRIQGQRMSSVVQIAKPSEVHLWFVVFRWMTFWQIGWKYQKQQVGFREQNRCLGYLIFNYSIPSQSYLTACVSAGNYKPWITNWEQPEKTYNKLPFDLYNSETLISEDWSFEPAFNIASKTKM